MGRRIQRSLASSAGCCTTRFDETELIFAEVSISLRAGVGPIRGLRRTKPSTPCSIHPVEGSAW